MSAKRKRDTKAEYRARKAKEAARGYSSPSAATRARRAGKATSTDEVARRGSRARQVFPNVAGQTIVSTLPSGAGAHVVERRVAGLDPDTEVTIHVQVKSGPDGFARRDFTITTDTEGEPLTAGALQGDELRAVIADLVTYTVTSSGKAHHRPGAPVMAFEADDVVTFDVSWSAR